MPEKDSTSPKRRRWTANEKRAILAEANVPDANVSAIARRHGVTPSMLFNWRRQGQGDDESQEGGDDADVKPIYEYRQMLSTLAQRETLLELAAKRISEAVESGNMGGYHIACSISNLVNATGKLQERRLDLIERLAAAEETATPEGSPHPDNVDQEIRNTAERITYELVQREVLSQRDASRIHCAS